MPIDVLWPYNALMFLICPALLYVFFFQAEDGIRDVAVTGVQTCFFFSSRRRHTRCSRDWSSDVCSSDLVVDVANVDPLGQDLVFARVVSKLREHLERRDLGVEAVVVFVDELNKYAPADGPETYVKKMLLDISERGRYLGLVLFGAEQFRSQVHRRVVGNAGTIVFGRMDSDELATPGYQVLSPATKIKLATLPIGELMVRHPHFTQPIFVRFP